jgi:hypothetical protein
MSMKVGALAIAGNFILQMYGVKLITCLTAN